MSNIVIVESNSLRDLQNTIKLRKSILKAWLTKFGGLYFKSEKLKLKLEELNKIIWSAKYDMLHWFFCLRNVYWVVFGPKSLK